MRNALTSLVSKKVDVVVGAVTSGATEGLINEAIKEKYRFFSFGDAMYIM